MRSLSVKLTLVVLFVSLVGVALVATYARQETMREFDRLVLAQARTNFVDQVTAFYQQHGSWVDVGDAFRRRAPGVDVGRQETQQPSRPALFLLTDTDGRVLVPARPYAIGDSAPANMLAQGVPVRVDGVPVGTVVDTGTFARRNPLEERYVARTNQALVFGALGAIVVALILGALLARSLTHPLRELTAAARAMASGDLEKRVAVRSQDELGELAMAFNQLGADLNRAIQTRRQMTADIAHELRTPMTVIGGYLEAMRDGVLTPTSERLTTMCTEMQHLHLLVEDLRTLSLADAGELSLDRRIVPVQELLTRVATVYDLPAQHHEIDLRVKVSPDTLQVTVDPERFVQVLGNLVTNALRFTPAGGHIVLAARCEADTVQLSVRDSGTGISTDVLPHIFDRFYRGDDSRHQNGRESGLGLAIAKSIVEAHGGHMGVHSALGQGAEFTIDLPNSQAR